MVVSFRPTNYEILFAAMNGKERAQFSFDGRRDGFSASRSIRRIWVSGTCARIELYLLIDVYSCSQVISVRLFRIIISITF